MNGHAGTLRTKGRSLSLAPPVSVHLGFIRPRGGQLIYAGGSVQLMLSDRKRSPVVFSLRKLLRFRLSSQSGTSVHLRQ